MDLLSGSEKDDLIAKFKNNDGEIITGKYNINLSHSHVSCLFNKCWVNDEVINVMCAIYNELQDESHWYNSLFYDTLTGAIRDSMPGSEGSSSSLVYCGSNGYDYDRVRRWNKDLILSSFKKLFFFINEKNQHWFIVVADFESSTITAYDSLRTTCRETDCVHISRYIQDKSGVPVEQWVLNGRGLCDEQRNGYNCGIHSIMNAKHLCKGLPVTGHSDQWYQECRLLVAYEVIYGIVYNKARTVNTNEIVPSISSNIVPCVPSTPSSKYTMSIGNNTKGIVNSTPLVTPGAGAGIRVTKTIDSFFQSTYVKMTPSEEKINTLLQRIDHLKQSLGEGTSGSIPNSVANTATSTPAVNAKGNRILINLTLLHSLIYSYNKIT